MATESREAEGLNSDIREQAAQHTLAANPLVGCAAMTSSLRQVCWSAK